MALTNAYCSLEQLKLHLNVPDSFDDDKAEMAISAASRQIDAHCGDMRQLWLSSATSVRHFEVDDSTHCYVDDISTTTGLVVKVDTNGDGTYADTLTLNTHYILEPYNAAHKYPVRPYTEIEIVDGTGGYFPTGPRPGVQVTAKFGWPAVPDDVTKACVIQAALLFKAQDATFGAAQLGLDGSTVFIGQLHATARGLLEPYVRRDAM